MRVSIVGTGYVGLVTGVCLADQGHRVTCVDVDADRIRDVSHGIAPFHEPGLPELLRRHAGNRFTATTDLTAAVLESDLTLIAVGTPSEAGRIDLTQVRRAASAIGAALADKRDYHLVVVKSTVVPGTTDQIVTPLLKEASGLRAGVAFGIGANPEFLSEGQAIADFLQPDRIVLGASDDRACDLLARLYASFPAKTPRLRTTVKAAEMIKYASNALLATLISYSNEIGNLCSALGGIDCQEVMRGVHLSQYLTPLNEGSERTTAPIAAFLAAGCGFGGSCLPKDVQALAQHGEQAGQSMSLLRAVLEVNNEQPRRMLMLLRKHFPALDGVRVAVLGLAFKPETDDVRMSPALPIVRELLAQGARVAAYDPVANSAARRALADDRVEFRDCLAAAVSDADAVLLVTRWDEFRRLPELLSGRHPQPVCIDGRRMIDRRLVDSYEGIGV